MNNLNNEGKKALENGLRHIAQISTWLGGFSFAALVTVVTNIDKFPLPNASIYLTSFTTLSLLLTSIIGTMREAFLALPKDKLFGSVIFNLWHIFAPISIFMFFLNIGLLAYSVDTKVGSIVLWSSVAISLVVAYLFWLFYDVAEKVNFEDMKKIHDKLSKLRHEIYLNDPASKDLAKIDKELSELRKYKNIVSVEGVVCSFCGDLKEHTEHLIGSEDSQAYICNKCIAAGMQLIERENL